LHFYTSLGSSVKMEFKRKHVSSATLVMFEETEV